MTPSPKVTVAMPVYNGSATLQRAIDSVLVQTYRDFELLIIDDGSSDNSIERISKNSDPRIRLVVHEKNRGLAETRNHLVEESRGEYVAWLDQDDWSHPERLERQVAVLQSTDDYVLCGTWALITKTSTTPNAKTRFENRIKACTGYTPQEIRSTQLVGNVLPTSSITMKIETIQNHDLEFRSDFAPSEDFDMWARIGAFGALYMLPQLLTFRTESATSASAVGEVRQRQAADRVRQELLDLMGVKYTLAELETHNNLASPGRARQNLIDPDSAIAWLDSLLEANRATGTFDQKALETLFGGIVLREIVMATGRHDLGALKTYTSSRPARNAPYWVASRLRLLGRSIRA